MSIIVWCRQDEPTRHATSGPVSATATACARALGCRRSQRERRHETCNGDVVSCSRLEKTSQLTWAYFTSRPIKLRPSADGTAEPLCY